MRPIDADQLCEGRVSNDPVAIAAKCAPALDYAPVRRGEWIEKRYEYAEETILGYKCSKCGRVELAKEPYCHCGAKMDGGKNDENA